MDQTEVNLVRWRKDMNVNVSRYFWPVKGIYGPFLWPKCPPSFKSPSRVTQPFLFILRSHHNLKGKVVPKMGKSRPVKSDIRYEEFFSGARQPNWWIASVYKTPSIWKNHLQQCIWYFVIHPWIIFITHLYPLGLSRALRQARLPSAYKCISCPWTSCTTWNRGDADDESEISRMVFSFLRIWWWFCTMTGLLAVSNRIFFELLLPQLESKYKKVFSLFVLLYIGSRICISFINPKSASTAT